MFKRPWIAQARFKETLKGLVESWQSKWRLDHSNEVLYSEGVLNLHGKRSRARQPQFLLGPINLRSVINDELARFFSVRRLSKLISKKNRSEKRKDLEYSPH
jgi:hypothetical protein